MPDDATNNTPNDPFTKVCMCVCGGQSFQKTLGAWEVVIAHSKRRHEEEKRKRVFSPLDNISGHTKGNFSKCRSAAVNTPLTAD